MSSGSKPATSRSNYFDLNALTKTVDVSYNAGKNLNEIVTVTARYVEICPSENPRATVVGLSGSPGTHNDFKYMKDFLEKKNIRLLCFNWPGSEFVTGGFENSYSNPERNSYAKALMKQLNVPNCRKVVIMGHSRGGENALQLCSLLTGPEEQWPIIGAVLINSPGFEAHRGVKPRMGVINTIAYLIKLQSSLINSLMFPVLEYFYTKVVGLRVANGQTAAAAILPMTTFAFEKQKEAIADLKNKPSIRAFYGYGANDFLIEEHISDEFANEWEHNEHFVIPNREEAVEVIEKAKKSLLNGTRFITANFKQEGHYLQKTYPDFIIDIIEAMIDSEELKNGSNL